MKEVMLHTVGEDREIMLYLGKDLAWGGEKGGKHQRPDICSNLKRSVTIVSIEPEDHKTQKLQQDFCETTRKTRIGRVGQVLVDIVNIMNVCSVRVHYTFLHLPAKKLKYVAYLYNIGQLDTLALNMYLCAKAQFVPKV
eukprot:scaffold138085_cov17-Tisochrysis_lutea.AAC.2